MASAAGAQISAGFSSGPTVWQWCALGIGVLFAYVAALWSLRVSNPAPSADLLTVRDQKKPSATITGPN